MITMGSPLRRPPHRFQRRAANRILEQVFRPQLIIGCRSAVFVDTLADEAGISTEKARCGSRRSTPRSPAIRPASSSTYAPSRRSRCGQCSSRNRRARRGADVSPARSRSSGSEFRPARGTCGRSEGAEDHPGPTATAAQAVSGPVWRSSAAPMMPARRAARPAVRRPPSRARRRNGCSVRGRGGGCRPGTGRGVRGGRAGGLVERTRVPRREYHGRRLVQGFAEGRVASIGVTPPPRPPGAGHEPAGAGRRPRPAAPRPSRGIPADACSLAALMALPSLRWWTGRERSSFSLAAAPMSTVLDAVRSDQGPSPSAAFRTAYCCVAGRRTLRRPGCRSCCESRGVVMPCWPRANRPTMARENPCLEGGTPWQAASTPTGRRWTSSSPRGTSPAT